MISEKYFDYNATTPTDPRVLKSMEPFFCENFHNPSSFYRDAASAGYAIEKSREQISQLINCRQDEIIFTSGGTESDNLAIQGVVRALKSKGNHIITSQIEHPAVLETFKYLAGGGMDVTFLPVDSDGLVDPDVLAKSIKKGTVLISIMHANNETGTIQPLKELIQVAHRRGILFHTDAVQSTGKIPVDVKDLDVDLLSFSSHKIYGPKGMGVLYKRKGLKLEPLLFGGGHEYGLRAGTENVSGIVGLGTAAELIHKEMAGESARLTKLRDRIQAGIQNGITEIVFNGSLERRLFNTINVSIRYIEGESILAMLDQKDFALSSGSACSSKSLDPSHVLLALGLSHEDAHGSLRISLGKYNTSAGGDALIEVLPGIVERLRSISPFWKGK